MAEKCFWNAVKTDRFMGLHFRRQQVIHGFIADFYCEELKLVVEIDGGIHEEQKDYDKLRDNRSLTPSPLWRGKPSGGERSTNTELKSSALPTKKCLTKAIWCWPR